MNLSELIFFSEKFPNAISVYIPGSIRNDQKTILSLANLIDDSFRKNSNKQILFNLAGDGLEEYSFSVVHQVAAILHNSYSINYEKITLLNGAAPIYYNIQKYRELCRLYGWQELKILFSNTYEQLVRDEVWVNKSLYNNVNRVPCLKNKRFMMLTRVCRPHKALAIAEILKNDWLDQGIVSFYSNTDEIKGQLKQTEHRNFLEYSDVIDTHANLFPLPLNLNLSQSNTFDYGVLNTIEYFQNSYINIVLESLYYETRNKNHYGYDSILMSEKIFKPIAMKQPFIVLARPGYLNALKNMGYKTFHPYINESYDTIQDDNERFDAVFKELKRLMSFGDRDWVGLLTNVRDTLKFNFMNLDRSEIVFYPEYLYSELI